MGHPKSRIAQQHKQLITESNIFPKFLYCPLCIETRQEYFKRTLKDQQNKMILRKESKSKRGLTRKIF